MRLACWVLLAQALFWGLFYIPWSGARSGFSVDRISVQKYEVAEILEPSAARADATPHRPVELPYTDCCDPAYLSLKATFSIDEISEQGLGLIAFQQADNYQVRLNGSLIHAPGTMQFGEQSFHGQRAYLVRLPAGLLKKNENQLSFITVRDGYPYTDLYPLLLGEYTQVEAETENRFWQTVDLRWLGGWLTFILGLFATVLLIRSRAKRFAGWLVALCWS